jgi:diacylglycerol kinase (ATP)
LRFALAGIAHGLRSAHSLRAQALALVAVLIALAVLRPAPLWWAVVLLASSAALAAVLICTLGALSVAIALVGALWRRI